MLLRSSAPPHPPPPLAATTLPQLVFWLWIVTGNFRSLYWFAGRCRGTLQSPCTASCMSCVDMIVVAMLNNTNFCSLLWLPFISKYFSEELLRLCIVNLLVDEPTIALPVCVWSWTTDLAVPAHFFFSYIFGCTVSILDSNALCIISTVTYCLFLDPSINIVETKGELC